MQFRDEARFVHPVSLRPEGFQQPFDQLNAFVLRKGQGCFQNG